MGTLKVLMDDFSHIICKPCNEKLVPTTVELVYLASRFSVELPACPKCGKVFIPKDLAVNKMLEVEKLLEDK